MFAVQDEIARAVVGALRGHLTERESAALVRSSTPNVEAYNLYLKGRYHWYRRTTDGLRQAISFFEQAVARDPTYALAYTGIGDVYSLLGSHDYGAVPPAEAFPAARRALARALELDPGSAATHATLGNVHFIFDWDWTAAEREFRRALQLEPACAPAHHWYALGLMATGRGEEAMTAIRRARELEPLSMVLSTALARVLYFAGESRRAIEEYRRGLEMDPTFVTAHLGLGLTLVQSGDPEPAIAEYQAAKVLLGGEPPLVLALIAHASAVASDRAEARSILARLQSDSTRSYVPAEYIALVHLGLGERGEAVHALERAFANRSGAMAFLRVDPLLHPLRGDPAFESLLGRITL
ncbi:MAG: tetratricopeptide repeat protein [Gemmatimonadetes bacterium]|nr:tetratricopeptide repeat protein [Gemmatimonadota bacterium]